MLKVVVIFGSVRESRRGIRVADFVVNKLKERKHKVTLIDPMKEKFPMIDKMHSEFPKGKAPKNIEKVHKILKEADAYVIVSAEYNHSIPPALSNLMDHYMKEYFFKPSGIVCYSKGPFGGVRAAMQLRAFLGELGTPSIPSIFPVSNVGESFDAKGNALDENYDRRIKKFLDELEWYANALKAQREKDLPY